MFSSKQHIKSLDGLRGIAILLVFLFHYSPPRHHSPLAILSSIGWSGVDLFFVLSGFLITGILYDTRGSSSFFKAFYIRRALRLLPVYMLAVAVMLVVTSLNHFHRNWLELPYFVYAANIVWAFRLNVGSYPPYIECGHFWSLALEEQFYSLWPIVVFFAASRRRLMHICIWGIAAAIACRIALIALGAPPRVCYFELPARMDSLLAGALLALLVRGQNSGNWLTPSRLHWMLSGFTLAIILVLLKAHGVSYVSLPMIDAGYTLIAGGFACILALTLIPGTLEHRIGNLAFLRFFGKYSYGLYVWHVIPILFCRSVIIPWFRNHMHPAILADVTYTSVMLAFFTTVAVLSYHLVEKPFIKLKSRFYA